MKSHIYKRIILNFDSQNAFDVTYTELKVNIDKTNRQSDRKHMDRVNDMNSYVIKSLSKKVCSEE